MEYTIEIPFIKLTGYDAVTAALIKTKFKNIIIPKYGAYVNNISKATGVPVNLIYSFIFIESSGEQGVPSTGTEQATGLMQVTPDTAFDTINFELSSNGLCDAEKTIIKKYYPTASLSGTSLGTLAAFQASGSPIKAALMAALTYPEFNILIGAQFLGRIIDDEVYYIDVPTGTNLQQWVKPVYYKKSSVNPSEKVKKIRIDHVITRYNANYYLKYSKPYNTVHHYVDKTTLIPVAKAAYDKLTDANEKGKYSSVTWWDAVDKTTFYNALWDSGKKYQRYVGGIKGVMDILTT